MRVALEALREIGRKFSESHDGPLGPETGTATRHVGRFHNFRSQSSNRTSPVVFISCPFLTLEAPSATTAEENNAAEKTPRTLLNTLYGYDADDESEKQQIVQKLRLEESKGRKLHVRQTWILLIGHQVLITVSNHTMEAMLGQSLVLGNGTSEGEHTIMTRLRDYRGNAHNIVLDRSSTYEEFLERSVALAGSTADQVQDFEFVDDNSNPFDKADWKKLMITLYGSNVTLVLVPKAIRHDNDRPILALPATAGTVNDPPSSDDRALVPFYPSSSVKNDQTSEARLDDWLVGRQSDFRHVPATEGDKSDSQSSKIGLRDRLEDRDTPSRAVSETQSDSLSSSPTNLGALVEGAKGLSRGPPETRLLSQETIPPPPRKNQQDEPLTVSHDLEIHGDIETTRVSPWPYLVYEPRLDSPPPLEHIKIWGGMAIPMSSSQDDGTSIDVNMDSSSCVDSCSSESSDLRNSSDFGSTSDGSSNNLASLPSDNELSGIPNELANFGASYYDFTPSVSSEHSLGSAEVRYPRWERQQTDWVDESRRNHVNFASKDSEKHSAGNDVKSISESLAPMESQPLSPFFLWRPRGRCHERTPEESGLAAQKLLDQVQTKIKENLKGNLYIRAFQCSRADFIARQKFHLQNMPLSLVDSLEHGSDSKAMPESQDGEPSSPEPESPTSRTGPSATAEAIVLDPGHLGLRESVLTSQTPSNHRFNPVTPVKILTSTYDAWIIRQLYQISGKIFSVFAQKSGGTDAHEVSNLYWGALDYIFRVRLTHYYLFNVSLFAAGTMAT